jgi:hypothetical protein
MQFNFKLWEDKFMIAEIYKLIRFFDKNKP